MVTEDSPLATYRPPWLDAAHAKKVAVLGADGFIGSHVVALALEAGAEVVAICVKEPWRLSELSSPRLAIYRARRWWLPDAESIFREALAGCSGLALLGYEPPGSSAPQERLAHELEVNVGGALRVAALATEAGVRVVFASSADVYGPWHDAPVDEGKRPAPATPYAAAKLEAEGQLAGLAQRRAVSLRIATVYGPGEDGPRAIPSFVRALRDGQAPVVHGDGSDVHDYVHVADVAGAVVNACLRPIDAEVLNVGSGVGRTTLEILRALEAAAGRRPEPRFVAGGRRPARLVLDVALAADALGFGSRRDFDDAVEEEVAWLMARSRGGEAETLVHGMEPPRSRDRGAAGERR